MKKFFLFSILMACHMSASATISGIPTLSEPGAELAQIDFSGIALRRAQAQQARTEAYRTRMEVEQENSLLRQQQELEDLEIQIKKEKLKRLNQANNH